MFCKKFHTFYPLKLELRRILYALNMKYIWVTEVRSKILSPLETTGGNYFSLEGFEKMLFIIQHLTQGDLHSTGGIHMSFLGGYNSTGGIQISFLGTYNSTGGIRLSFQGVFNSTGGIQISFLGVYNSTGGIQISFRGVIIPLEGLGYPS